MVLIEFCSTHGRGGRSMADHDYLVCKTAHWVTSLWAFASFSGLYLKLSTLRYSARLREIITQVLGI